jgi:ribulose-5-phosphate 4-epimerase/fuculose-1-phosphate aldolase
MRSSASVRDHVTDAEWKTRCQLALIYRLSAQLGWDEFILTHHSARIPDEPSALLLNSFDCLFAEVTASKLVKVNMNGDGLVDNGHRANPAAITLHASILGARADVNAVMHLHTICGAAVSIQKSGLLPISQHALVFGEEVAYHDFEGILLSKDEGKRICEHLGSRDVMFLRNHGTVVLGRSITDAFVRTYLLERACQIQIAAQSNNAELVVPADEVRLKTAKQSSEFRKGLDAMWPLVSRMLSCPAEEYEV